MKLRVLAVGRTRVPYVRAGLDDYLGRIRGGWSVEWLEVKAEDASEPAHARAREAERLVARLDEGRLVTLEVEGRALSSAEWAATLGRWRDDGERTVTLVIGGAYGIDPSITARASLALSLSRMTFPHQLVRIVLAEQLYRAITILEGAPYHH